MASNRPGRPSSSASGLTQSRTKPTTSGSASMRAVCWLGWRTKRSVHSVSVSAESRSCISVADRLEALLEDPADFAAVDLVGARERQLLHQEDDARMRESRAVLEAVALQRFRLERRAGPRHDRSDRRQAFHAVRMRHDCRVDDVGVADQQVLDVLRIDVLAAAREHVVDSAAKKVKPLLVHAEEVASLQPAVDDAA